MKDFNSPDVPVDVCAPLDAAINENMQRVSSLHAFIPVDIARERRGRLKLCINALATRVVVSSGTAVGVDFESIGGDISGTYRVRAKKEIVICCGALGSPQLLLLRLVNRCLLTVVSNSQLLQRHRSKDRARETGYRDGD